MHPPSLLELSARVIRTSSISFEPHEIPRTLRDYLNTAHHCVNPKCKGKLINFQFMCVRVCFFWPLWLSIPNNRIGSTHTHTYARSTFVIGDNEERKKLHWFCLICIDLGVFFDNRVEHIKFVDFCGRYRVPLLQYLCSSK